MYNERKTTVYYDLILSPLADFFKAFTNSQCICSRKIRLQCNQARLLATFSIDGCLFVNLAEIYEHRLQCSSYNLPNVFLDNKWILVRHTIIYSALGTFITTRLTIIINNRYTFVLSFNEIIVKEVNQKRVQIVSIVTPENGWVDYSRGNSGIEAWVLRSVIY
jgi:hypothetical protein